MVDEVLDAGHSSSSAWASSNWLCWSTAARAVWVNPSCATMWPSIRPAARMQSPLPLRATSGPRPGRALGQDESRAHRATFRQALGAEAECLWDGCHNSITRREHEGETVWVHRKGAVASRNEAVVIPGSRGSLSYLVKPMGDGESHAWSLAHGAGRKWARSEARQRMRERFGVHQLTDAFGWPGHLRRAGLALRRGSRRLQEHRGRDSGPRGCRTCFGHRDVPTAPHLQDARVSR
jgi:hypothetical protein